MVRHDRIIPPGQEGTVAVQLHTKGYQGNLRKRVHLMTNDPNQERIHLEVRAFVAAPIVLQPRLAVLRGDPSRDIQTEVRIENHTSNDLQLTPAGNSCPEKVQFELKTLKAGKTYTLVLYNTMQGPGRYSGSIRFATNLSAPKEIEIFFMGFLQQGLDAARPLKQDTG